MGGLSTLLLAEQNPSSVTSFINIEENLASKIASSAAESSTTRKTIPNSSSPTSPSASPQLRYHGSALYAAALPHKVRAGAVSPNLLVDGRSPTAAVYSSSSSTCRHPECSCTAAERLAVLLEPASRQRDRPRRDRALRTAYVLQGSGVVDLRVRDLG